MLCVDAFFDPGVEASLRPPATICDAFSVVCETCSNANQTLPKSLPASGGTPRRFGMGVVFGESPRPSKTQGRATQFVIEGWVATVTQPRATTGVAEPKEAFGSGQMEIACFHSRSLSGCDIVNSSNHLCFRQINVRQGVLLRYPVCVGSREQECDGWR